ncbi:heme-dependent oxidative N-demethylase family protein [Frigidibacter sp. ROC022]|uniref:heme-dependent oxidative N-demethylase family protein n=1 Tax=Frigidibacter sp. ROC022 TaxID=2971796 RepID=UPI00215AD6B7|nr:DUF3445 domain-containing protein [Frigidibacter sp. ROC022]MCR8723419.1 DUF3445 domain-containing protein [Frigidibacter sp. ROC022]
MILHDSLPYRPWSDPALKRLPGVQPLGALPWLLQDEVFAAQMAERDRLLARHRAQVLADSDDPAVAELLSAVLAYLAGCRGYAVSSQAVRRPDGVTVDLAADGPMATLARLVQEDLLLHVKRGDEHVLIGGTLLFPSSWTLAEKAGRPLSRIHRPVPSYAAVARSVQRMFDALRPGTPLWRANWLIYRDPALFQPRREGERKPARDGAPGYLRSERQTFLKLPGTGAVVFGIHTYVLPLDRFAAELPPGALRESDRPAAGPGA